MAKFIEVHVQDPYNKNSTYSLMVNVDHIVWIGELERSRKAILYYAPKEFSNTTTIETRDEVMKLINGGSDD